MVQNIQKACFILLIAVFTVSCKSDNSKSTKVDVTEKTTRRKVPKFDNEKAYQNIEK